jgi:hypothetical protein
MKDFRSEILHGWLADLESQIGGGVLVSWDSYFSSGIGRTISLHTVRKLTGTGDRHPPKGELCVRESVPLTMPYGTFPLRRPAAASTVP